ncbi:MAG: hypothetical protein WBA66_02095 [Xanthobacteraceae bacterium]
MTDDTTPPLPQRQEHPQRRLDHRLSAALRENLKRRKAQARGRAAAAERPEQSEAAPVAAGDSEA